MKASLFKQFEKYLFEMMFAMKTKDNPFVIPATFLVIKRDKVPVSSEGNTKKVQKKIRFVQRI